MPDRATRIVSLIPAATEIICALGLEDQLVGRSHSCDYPPSILHLPECTSVNIDVTASSREIDQQVRDAGTTSVYEINEFALRELQPGVIVTQGVCELCAAGPSLVNQAVANLEFTPRVFALKAERLADVWDEIDELAEFLGVGETGRQGTAGYRDRTELKSAETEHRPSVVFLDWIDPLMTAGHWVPDVIAAGGGQDAFSNGGDPSQGLTWNELIAADPEVILIAPCGFTLERSLEELSILTEHKDWSSLNAVRSGQVYVADGQRLFNRPGPGLADSVEAVRQMLAGHEESAYWQRLLTTTV